MTCRDVSPSGDGIRPCTPWLIFTETTRGQGMRGKQLIITAAIALAVTVGYSQYVARRG